MKINKLKINDFGKFSNKQIELSDNINVIKGNNESGKSTIQKFIVSMLYGISKDKRKSSFTDYEKYFPWGKESFSGKLSYTLDDGKKYEVFRDFTKKSPVLYNERAEDITKEYSSNKKSGSSFFEEQTGIDEKTMMSSMISEQGEVTINQADENFVIQKIANMAETGDEKISYEFAQKIISNRRNEDIGTDRTKGKPINLIKEERMKLNSEKEELEEYNKEQYSIEEKINEIKSKKGKDEEILDFATKYKRILDEQSGLKNKVTVYKEAIARNDTKQDELERVKNSEEQKLRQAAEYLEEEIAREEQRERLLNEEIENLTKTAKKKVKAFYIVAGIFLVISIALFFISIIAGCAGTAVALIVLIIGLITKKKYDKKIEDRIQSHTTMNFGEQQTEIGRIKDRIREAELGIDVLKRSTEDCYRNAKEIEKIINDSIETNVNNLVKERRNITEEQCNTILQSENIAKKIEYLQIQKNNDMVELEKYDYTKKHILPKLERLADVEERLFELDEREEELSKHADAISMASKVLEEAYKEMKETIVPKFTKNLSDTIAKVSNRKYSKVVTNDKEGLLVEAENGEYVPAKALSMGTIDQLYLSLRFSLSKELTNQKIPIILDEAFAYYDSDRLRNILKYISEEFENNQVIIFTCTSREIKMLNEMNIKFNLIEI